MTKAWVETNIGKLIKAGDPMGFDLQNAMSEGNLSGITYSTPIENGVPQSTRVIKADFF